MRASELNRTLSLQPDLFQKLLECFVISRAVTKISSIFPCLQNHPLLVGLRGKSRRSKSSASVSVLRVLLYRDSVTQHGNISAAAALRESTKGVREQQRKSFEPKKARLTQDRLFGQAAVEFVRSICSADPGAILSIEDVR